MKCIIEILLNLSKKIIIILQLSFHLLLTKGMKIAHKIASFSHSSLWVNFQVKKKCKVFDLFALTVHKRKLTLLKYILITTKTRYHKERYRSCFRFTFKNHISDTLHSLKHTKWNQYLDITYNDKKKKKNFLYYLSLIKIS